MTIESKSPLRQGDGFAPFDDQISLVGIMGFLKKTYKIILFSGFCGLIVSVIYLIVTPKKYEAIAQITMAQIGGPSIKDRLNSLGVNVEEPSVLVVRLSIPTSFPLDVIRSCGSGSAIEHDFLPNNVIQIQPSKKGINLVELRAFGASPEAAKLCAIAVFDLIKATQGEIMASYIQEASDRLADSELRLEKAKSILAHGDKSGAGVGLYYLLARDEINSLLSEINFLKIGLLPSYNRPAKLIAPIYVSNIEFAPKAPKALMLGLFGGLFMGLLVALACQALGFEPRLVQDEVYLDHFNEES